MLLPAPICVHNLNVPILECAEAQVEKYLKWYAVCKLSPV